MTILVAYVPRPEGQAALDKALEIAKERQEHLVVVNAGRDGVHEDASLAENWDVERIEARLAQAGVQGKVQQFVRGKSVLKEIEDLVDTLQVSLLVIGLRRRSAVGKLVLGSVARDILLSVPCPVLAVKAH
jgi:nucleotide-binding universal stress UspA family protein